MAGFGPACCVLSCLSVCPSVCLNHTLSRQTRTNRRYHYYLQRDTTLAESVSGLQPTWQAGIVRKVLDGLKCGGGRNHLRGDNSDRRGGGTSEGSSCSGDSSGPEDAGDAAGTESAAAAAAGEGAEDGEDAEEGEEDQDKFEVTATPGRSPRLAGSTVTRVGQGSDLSRAGDGGCGGGASAVVGGEHPASPTATPAAATPAENNAGATTRRQEGQAAAGAGVGGAVAAAAAAAAGMPEIPDCFRPGVESRLGETCAAFQTSIRRAVLNYVLLDAGQRDRLGTGRDAAGRANSLIDP